MCSPLKSFSFFEDNRVAFSRMWQKKSTFHSAEPPTTAMTLLKKQVQQRCIGKTNITFQSFNFNFKLHIFCSFFLPHNLRDICIFQEKKQLWLLTTQFTSWPTPQSSRHSWSPWSQGVGLMRWGVVVLDPQSTYSNVSRESCSKWAR